LSVSTQVMGNIRNVCSPIYMTMCLQKEAGDNFKLKTIWT